MFIKHNILTGFVIGNAFEINLNDRISSILRSIGLIVILLRAGLELDPKAVLKLSTVCLRLSFTPLIIEAIVVAFASHLLLDFPIEWGFLLGFVLGAVSPAVVVPSMIALQEKGLGVDKSIPTIIIAAASIDDVMAITGFGICLGIVFDTNTSIVWSVFKGPVEALAGIAFGIVIGVILWFIPPNKESIHQRLTIILLAGIFAQFGSTALDMGGAGPLACLFISFVAAIRWRKTPHLTESLQQYLGTLWLIFQPFLFALIGTEVKLTALKGSAIGWALLTLAISQILRTCTAMSVVFGAALNLKEKLFIGFAWSPKATVQAAIGSIALDMARERDDQKSIELASLTLTIAVISILVTAPLGAVLISLLGPKFLNRVNKSEDNQQNGDTNVTQEINCS